MAKFTGKNQSLVFGGADIFDSVISIEYDDSIDSFLVATNDVTGDIKSTETGLRSVSVTVNHLAGIGPDAVTGWEAYMPGYTGSWTHKPVATGTGNLQLSSTKATVMKHSITVASNGLSVASIEFHLDDITIAATT